MLHHLNLCTEIAVFSSDQISFQLPFTDNGPLYIFPCLDPWVKNRVWGIHNLVSRPCRGSLNLLSLFCQCPMDSLASYAVLFYMTSIFAIPANSGFSDLKAVVP